MARAESKAIMGFLPIDPKHHAARVIWIYWLLIWIPMRGRD